ncbi:MAG: hypothetical protein ACLFQ5_09580 [Oceanicaulis sp.]
MAEIDAGAGAPEPKRYTFLAVMAMLGASLVAVALGFGGYGMWIPSMMTLSGHEAMAADSTPLFYAVMALMMGGPVFAALGFIAGWVAFTMFKAPWTGVRLTFFLPVIWFVALLAWMAFASAAPVCEGSLTCGW